MKRSLLDAASQAALSERIGHVFKTPGLLVEALTHSSVHVRPKKGKDYERLEFLGDRVLALVIAEMLHDAFPGETEGQLNRRLVSLVRAETCADVARSFGLAPFIILGESELRAGGRDKMTILGDVAESIIAAIYLDAGLEAARQFIHRGWAARLHLSESSDQRDPKTMLQEWAAARGQEPPVYAVLEQRGPAHEPEFRVAVELPGLGRSEGVGRTKRLAERAAAALLLQSAKE